MFQALLFLIASVLLPAATPVHAATASPAHTITVSGVFYVSPDRWLVWLNNQKVTPQDWLKEIVDIKVEKDAVHLRWFDAGKNGVINITLHPHETYDIDTGILTPAPAVPAPPPKQ